MSGGGFGCAGQMRRCEEVEIQSFVSRGVDSSSREAGGAGRLGG